MSNREALKPSEAKWAMRYSDDGERLAVQINPDSSITIRKFNSPDFEVAIEAEDVREFFRMFEAAVAMQQGETF